MPSSRNTVNIFDPNKKPIQIVFALAWPIFIENILSTLLHYVDAAMVGQLGAYATAAVSLLNQAYWVFGSLIGAVAGAMIPFDMTGVDFALTALFAVLTLDQIQKFAGEGKNAGK